MPASARGRGAPGRPPLGAGGGGPAPPGGRPRGACSPLPRAPRGGGGGGGPGAGGGGGGARKKTSDERRDLLTLVAALPAVPREEIVALWDEYEAGVTPEARLAKGLDKLETILQHTQGKNPRDFDYRFNLDYGRRYAEGHPLLAELRAILDEATERRAREAAQDD
ncbi:MAG: HD domain-containing protein [Gemmatimonadetes bacterium]|nr:HD domain-containing protein [Gemmatimonadota bacterium]